MKVIHLVIGVVILMSSSCLTLMYGRYGRYPLTMKKEPFVSEKLRIDGVYQYKNKISGGTSEILFYKNGVILLPSGINFFSINDKPRVVEYFKTITRENNPYHDIVFAWGIFKVENNDLIIESWMSGDGGDKYQTKVFNGAILNDSVFVILNGWSDLKLDTFHFIQMPIKPDSTCPFIPY